MNNVFIVAELSANHGGKIDIAIDTIKAAQEAGADAIKLQTYKPETMTMDSEKNDFIIKGGTIWDGEIYLNFIKKLSLLGNGTKNYLKLLKKMT